MSKRIAAVAALALFALLAAGCGGTGRTKERYYDPRGYFSAELPAANELNILGPQDGAGTPSLLSGVVSAPVPPTPAGDAFTAFGSAPQTDQTVFIVYVVDASAFESLDEFSMIHLSDPTADLKVRQDVTMGGHNGLLVVADHLDQAGQSFTVASGFAISGGLGYWLIAAFPQGEWASERAEFLDILQSFRTDVPAVVDAIPAVLSGA